MRFLITSRNTIPKLIQSLVLLISTVLLMNCVLEDVERPLDGEMDPIGACDEIYAPVCGSDGRTYSNDCHAESEGVDEFEDGECQGTPDDSLLVCPAVEFIPPICGENEGLVYTDQSGCNLEAECVPIEKECAHKVTDDELICERGTIKQTVLNDEGCFESEVCTHKPFIYPEHPDFCPMIDELKCGLDQKLVFTQDENGCSLAYCEEVDPVSCIEIYAPVCGSDGKTYSNSCFAEAAGVDNFDQGECEEIKCIVFIRDPSEDVICPSGQAAKSVYDENGCFIESKCEDIVVVDPVICPLVLTVMPNCASDEIMVPKEDENGCSLGYECTSECLTKDQYAPSANDPWCVDQYDQQGCYEGTYCQ